MDSRWMPGEHADWFLGAFPGSLAGQSFRAACAEKLGEA
jgi:hypothetical protein